ncbi:MAG: type II secretion system F family protein [Alphaproteobacteria bacterium]|nr:type II secretion system F family protein [Alphaproteobacteria bacterium]
MDKLLGTLQDLTQTPLGAIPPEFAILAGIFGAVLLTVIGLTLLPRGQGAVERRMGGDAVPGAAQASIRFDQGQVRWAGMLKAFEQYLGPMPEAGRSGIGLLLVRAGYLGPNAPRLYYILRILLAAGLPLAFLAISPLFPRLDTQAIMFIAAGCAGLGLYLPWRFVSSKAEARQSAIANSFPDALDMLVVCVEAGIGLDAAFTKVGMQIERAHPVLASHFAMVALELRAGKSREDALRNFALRTGVEEIRAFTTLLIQSEALGASVARTLRVYAEEMRTKRMLRAEEIAHKLPVKLVFPLVTCILPAMITAVLLPAIIRIVRQVLPHL